MTLFQPAVFILNFLSFGLYYLFAKILFYLQKKHFIGVFIKKDTW